MTLAAICVMGCGDEEETKEIDLGERRPISFGHTAVRGQKTIHIAVGGMITPKAGFGYYRQILDYLGGKVGLTAKFVDRQDYAEVNNLVRSGSVDVAFVCGGPYVDGHSEFGMELLVAPQVHGKITYYSYIIVHRDSDVQNLEALRGKTFAFTDPMSNSGRLAPTYQLAKLGETPRSFFGNFVFSKAHDRSIRMVAHRAVDGAAVDSLIWEYAARTNPKFTSQTRIVERFGPYGIPPVVVRPGLDSELKEKLRQVLLGIHEDEEGKKIIAGMRIGRFVVVADSHYDSIREMKKWLAEREREK